jgi:hypothetical protein
VDLKRLSRELDQARRRSDRATKRLRDGGAQAQAELRAAMDAQLEAERALAAARNQEHAVPFDLGVQWDVGAPLPHLLTSGLRTLLAFYLSEPDPQWDGTYVRVVDPSDEQPASLALVEFVACSAVKMGPPNDEVIHAHPLYGRGLAAYQPLTVVNSRWIAELIAINRVHEQFSAAHWEGQHHFLFPFHDETVEAVARDVRLATSREPMRALLARTLERLWD